MKIDIIPTTISLSTLDENQKVFEGPHNAYTAKIYKTVLDFKQISCFYIFGWGDRRMEGSVAFSEQELINFLPKRTVSDYIQSSNEIRQRQRAELEEWKKIVELPREERIEWYHKEPRSSNFIYYGKDEAKQRIDSLLEGYYQDETLILYNLTY